MSFLQRHWRHVALFFATLATTIYVGGVSYGLTLVFILFCHEMGHYVMCLRYRVHASLPYFIPIPFPPFGTFGAVIKMQGRIPDRTALFDIGIAGPIFGIVVAIPAAIIGLSLSEVIQLSDVQGPTVVLGDSLLFKALSMLVHPGLSDQQEIVLHPIGYAAWAGLFVTALNLVPIGQLDGGHVIYAMYYKQSKRIYQALFLIFAGIAIIIHPPLLIFLALVFFLTRLKHPPTMIDSKPLDKRRWWIGVGALIFFILSFPPIPMTVQF